MTQAGLELMILSSFQAAGIIELLPCLGAPCSLNLLIREVEGEQRKGVKREESVVSPPNRMQTHCATVPDKERNVPMQEAGRVRGASGGSHD